MSKVAMKRPCVGRSYASPQKLRDRDSNPNFLILSNRAAPTGGALNRMLDCSQHWERLGDLSRYPVVSRRFDPIRALDVV